MIGDGKISARTLPPEARALNRFFRLLEDPIVIREAMSDVLDKAPSSVAIDTIRSMLTSTLIKLEQFENRKDRIFEHKAAHGINLLVESSFADASIDLESLGSHRKATKLIATSGPASIGGSGSLGGHSLMSTNEKFTDAASIAMVSDSVSVSHGSRTERQPEALRTISAFWAYLLEAIHLQVVSRTTRIWGRKKIYEIYRLNGPVSHHKSLEQIRVDLLNEFRAIYSDIECRTYGLQRLDGNIFLHLVIGPPFDYTDERNRSQSGEKKKKKANEFIFIVNPGSNLMAVTASRAPSKSRFVKFVLTAADLALVATDKRAQNGEICHYCCVSSSEDFLDSQSKFCFHLNQLCMRPRLEWLISAELSQWIFCMQRMQPTLVKRQVDFPTLPPRTRLIWILLWSYKKHPLAVSWIALENGLVFKRQLIMADLWVKRLLRLQLK